jgi:hypothetical protein
MSKFGVREICDVVLKAKAATKIGNKIFYANEPVIYFDTLKTSSMEGAATTVYAQGGRGNARLVAWEGERTVTFTMEDALISPEGFMILSGAGLVDATESKPIYQHMTETVDAADISPISGEEGAISFSIPVSEKPYIPAVNPETGKRERLGNYVYVMFMKNGEVITEPYIPVYDELVEDENGNYTLQIAAHDIYDTEAEDNYSIKSVPATIDFDSVLVDFYVERVADAQQIEITADKFGGNYYLEASTLFRDQNGVDMPAEFIIPNCKIQSNFNFTMASSGDPSTFTFTMDAFPDYTRFDHSKKVLAAIQIIKPAGAQSLYRTMTGHNPEDEKEFM